MWKNRALYALALGGAVLFYCFYFGDLSWFALVGTAALPVFSLLASLPALSTAQAVLEAPGRVQHKAPCTVRLCVNARVPWARAQACLVLESESARSVVRLDSWGEAAAALEAQADTRHCGCVRCTVQSAWVYDTLGLFRRRLRTAGTAAVFVLPAPCAPRPVPAFPQAETAAALRPAHGPAQEGDLRLYRPGDSVRAIHWKLTAKRGEPIVREALEGTPHTLLLTVCVGAACGAQDEALGQLCWMSRRLLQKGLPHTVAWKRGEAVAGARVEDENELVTALCRALTPQEPGGAAQPWPQADWHWHAGPAPACGTKAGEGAALSFAPGQEALPDGMGTP